MYLGLLHGLQYMHIEKYCTETDAQKLLNAARYWVKRKEKWKPTNAFLCIVTRAFRRMPQLKFRLGYFLRLRLNGKPISRNLNPSKLPITRSRFPVLIKHCICNLQSFELHDFSKQLLFLLEVRIAVTRTLNWPQFGPDFGIPPYAQASKENKNTI